MSQPKATLVTIARVIDVCDFFLRYSRIHTFQAWLQA